MWLHYIWIIWLFNLETESRTPNIYRKITDPGYAHEGIKSKSWREVLRVWHDPSIGSGTPQRAKGTLPRVWEHII